MSESLWGVGAMHYSGQVTRNMIENEIMHKFYGHSTPAMHLNKYDFDAATMMRWMFDFTYGDSRMNQRVLAMCCRELLSLPAINNNMTAPNWKEIQVIYKLGERKYGLFGLKRETVVVTVPNPDYEAVKQMFRGERYLFIGSHRREEEGRSYTDECDDAYFLTESGRILTVSYSLRYYRGYMPTLSSKIFEWREIKTNREYDYIYPMVLIASYISKERFIQILKNYK